MRALPAVTDALHLLFEKRDRPLRMAWIMLNKTCMTPGKRHHIGAPEVVQLLGLMIVISLICKAFGPGIHPHVTVSIVVGLAVGLFFVAWPMCLKANVRQ